jgi:hypothetical protein
MFILTLALLSLVIALLRGGRPMRLAQVPLRHAYLVVLGLGVQVVIFSSWWSRLGGEPWIPSLYILSMLILAVWFVLNLRLPGMTVIGLGLLLNLVAIAANGGRMPTSSDALERAGMATRISNPQEATHANSSLANEETRLYYLTDIFALPKGIPLANVFSIGDVCVALGAMYFIQRVLTDDHLDELTTAG